MGKLVKKWPVRTSWYSKIMMDTERNIFIPDIADKYAYGYESESQYEVWKSIGYFYGNDVMLKKTVGTTEIQLYFTNYSELQIWVKGNEYTINSFVSDFEIAEQSIRESGWLLLAKDVYNRTGCFAYLEKNYLQKIENILNL